jgi:hypothetical protein
MLHIHSRPRQRPDDQGQLEKVARDALSFPHKKRDGPRRPFAVVFKKPG